MDTATIDWQPWHHQLGRMLESEFYQITTRGRWKIGLSCHLEVTVGLASVLTLARNPNQRNARFDQEMVDLVYRNLAHTGALKFPDGVSRSGEHSFPSIRNPLLQLYRQRIKIAPQRERIQMSKT